jgi:type III secretion system YscQ/HrcQ family protein
VSSETARALTLLARHGAGQPFTLAAEGCTDTTPTTWLLSMEPRAWQASVDAGGHVAFLDWGGALLSLALPRGSWDAWLRARLPDIDVDDLPAEFVDATVEAMVRDMLHGLRLGEVSEGVRVLPEGPRTDQATCIYAWRLTLQENGTMRTIVARLAADQAGLQRLADMMQRWAVHAADVSMDHIPVAMRARLGETVLSMRELRGLLPGDIVFFDRCLADAQGGVWFTTPDGQGIRARPCPEDGASRYVITHEWSLLMTDDSFDDPAEDREALPPPHASLGPHEPEEYDDLYHEVDPPAPGVAPEIPDETEQGVLDVDRVPVRLGFDLGEQTLMLGQLRRLRPGEIFDLQRRLDAGPLYVRVNGAIIGTAELVDIDGRAGARIHTLTLDPEEPCR